MKPIHLAAKGRLNETTSRAFPLNEAGAPKFDGKPGTIARIIEFLNVEKSKRYQPTSIQTFCNIYAYDYAFLLGAFLPRVWWTESALKRVKAGEQLSVSYGSTVVELNANSLYDWFRTESAAFGWKQVNSFAEAQAAANAGKCVIAVAANKNRSHSGHIVAVVPETDTKKAQRAQGIGSTATVIYPLQSQAGRTNLKYFSSNWWTKHEPLRVYVFG